MDHISQKDIPAFYHQERQSEMSILSHLKEEILLLRWENESR